MNLYHLHLVMNHVPMFTTLFGIIIFIVGLFSKNNDFKKLSLILFLLSGITVVITYLTGEPAEKIVEHLPGILESLIEKHEDAAKIATTITSLLGLAGLGGLIIYYNKKDLPKWFITIVLLLSIIAGGAIANTANLGGKIRHTELSASQSDIHNFDKGEKTGKSEKDEDDN